ncbi:hypothetical protein [Caballeronia catudaia]|uniref:hypothetical protein n=1 Tax=Caballeronia catudaia TaxID=1777136 RepID=UPI0011803FC3|nr:hypothetical protein [Caballeronia catudaia]
MTTPLAPRGNLAVESGFRESGAGRGDASAAVMRMALGRALLPRHAVAFDANAAGAPTDSAVDVSVVACTGATQRRVSAHAGRRAALARR